MVVSQYGLFLGCSELANEYRHTGRGFLSKGVLSLYCGLCSIPDHTNALLNMSRPGHISMIYVSSGLENY